MKTVFLLLAFLAVFVSVQAMFDPNGDVGHQPYGHFNAPGHGEAGYTEKTEYDHILAQLKKVEHAIHDLDLKLYEYERHSHLRFWMLIAFGFGSFTALTYQLVNLRSRLLEATAKDRAPQPEKTVPPDPTVIQKLEQLQKVERVLKVLEDMIQHVHDNMLDDKISKLFKKYLSEEEWNFYVEKEIKKSSSAGEFKKLLLQHVFDLQQEELRLTGEIKGWNKD
ncbi:hypothetical protein QR680_003786 [Steinernema hermaphroditum]|uniref:SXP/RAL-2 family protein Ani s 5-like cation-binding domain-containing protein n=1 Tax=Steinernema hermaphroditum TaxID=289476 RepID=A0AA39LSJ9_9BILA|nr:hypothetical protein QR680_003786 [Steinernema hermaphroditum]